MVPIPIVITTIHEPNEAIRKFAGLKGFTLFIAGDTKTPSNWRHANSEFLSVDTQNKRYPKLSTLIPHRHYARKNLAYVAAIQTGSDHLYETDDDNLPYALFPNFLPDKAVSLPKIAADTVFNVYSLFTNKTVWPRGLPLSYIFKKPTAQKSARITPLIQQSLADLDPDVDAIYRLTNGAIIKFAKNKKFALDMDTYCPFNSQNTYWHHSTFPLLYLPSTVDSRVTDIWRGYIAQRILWNMGSRLIFLSPSVYQKRNVHDFQKDFEQERDLYFKTPALMTALSSMKLEGAPEAMLRTVYTRLVKLQFFKEEELSILSEWLTFF